MTALVTGAAGGIGNAAYCALKKTGHDVLGHDLPPRCETGLSLDGDLLNPDVLQGVASAVTAAGPVRAVVAAHGIAGAGALHDIAAEDARKIMGINFETVVQLWHLLRAALEDSRGAFVVVSSQAGLVSERANGVYSASKSALAGWLQGLDGRTAARLRVVYPGATRTPLLESALRGMAAERSVSYETVLAERTAATPAGRLGQPADIGAAIAWAVDLQAQGLIQVPVTGGEVRW